MMYEKACIALIGTGFLIVLLFYNLKSTSLPQNIQQISYRKLRMLNNAVTLEDLRIPPANRLEKLSGDRAGQYRNRINNQWRICFEWIDGNAYNVEIVGYH